MAKESIKIENPGLFTVILVGFLFSILLFLYGISKLRTQNANEDIFIDTKTADEAVSEGGRSISDYFKDVPVNSGTGNTSEYYLEQDPFRDKCNASGNKKPSVVSGTVCYY